MKSPQVNNMDQFVLRVKIREKFIDRFTKLGFNFYALLV